MESKRRTMNKTSPVLGENLVRSYGHIQQLPCEVLLHITKYLREDDGVALALALSGAFYRLNRKPVVSNRCFFLTPRLWPVFFEQHIIPAAVTSFNVNHLYWLPAKLLADGIFQMKNLKELGVKDTQVTLPILAAILDSCPEIVKLDFGFRFENDWKNLKDDLKKVVLDSMAVRFKKLTCLKVSTCVHDARDYRHDPWQPVLLFMSLCRDCVDLDVEITYTGSDSELYPITYPLVNPTIQFNDLSQFIRETIYPHLGWMKSLNSLVLTKLGPAESFRFQSFMLDDLLVWLFTEERAPRSLQHLWIQGFNFQPEYESIYFCALSLKSCQVERFPGEEDFTSFPNLEIVAAVSFTLENPHIHLPNLKYAHGTCETFSEETVYNFVQRHPNLEYLTIHDLEFLDEYLYYLKINNQEFVQNRFNGKLLNLRVLNYVRDSIDKGIIESMVENFPNVEILYLHNKDEDLSEISFDQEECLSSINFQNLTSLSLKNFKLHDGFFLPTIIKHCPKLQRLNMCKIPYLDPSFASNLDLFLPLAEKLRDVRMEFTNFNGSMLLPLLKSFFKNSPQLERLALLDGDCEDSWSEWDHPDDSSKMANFIVHFSSNMPRLVALCINFYHLDCFDLIEEVNRRIMEEVLPSKPSFWFYFGADGRPIPSNSNVPFIHYQEMVSPSLPCDPPKIELLD